MYSRLKKEGENFGMNTMISICISLDVGYAATVKILELAGYTFRHGNSLHDIYITLVMYHGGNRAEQFNDLLKSYGYTKKTERLGPQK